MCARTSSLVAFSLYAFLLTPVALFGQEDMAREADEAPDRSAIVASALSAAPTGIAADASVADWDGNVLRVGMNDYTCLPDDPDVPGNSPMCLDSGWMAWAEAWQGRTDPPELESLAFGYMLQGDSPVSNVDPYATEPTDDNDWIEDSGPHIMMLVPDPSMLDGITTDHENGGPWVMWKDTPYVHVMIPTTKKN